MSQAITSDGSSAIERQVHMPADDARARGPVALEAFYDIVGAGDFVRSGNFRKVALQFPDWLLPDAVDVLSALEAKCSPEVELYVLADTSYREDCVDEVAAQHIDAECVIHYGPATLAQPSHMPVYYDLCKAPVESSVAASALEAALLQADCAGKCVLLLADSSWQHALPELQRMLSASDGLSMLRGVVAGEVETQQFPAGHELAKPPVRDASLRMAGCSVALPASTKVEDCIVCFIGPENSPALRVLQLTRSALPVLLWEPGSPSVARDVTGHRTREIMQRFSLIEKAKLASTFGIVVGTLGVAHYATVLAAAEHLVRSAGASVYTFAVGKLNVPKLANFSEIDVFVLVDHPDGAVLPRDVSREFHAPVITPYELAMALQPEHEWTGSLVLDFADLLQSVLPPAPQVEGGRTAPGAPPAAARSAAATSVPEVDADKPFWSPITGQYEQPAAAKRAAALEASGVTDVVAFSQGGALARFDPSTAAAKFHARDWKGVSADVTDDAPTSIQQGLHGRAATYSGEGEQ